MNKAGTNATIMKLNNEKTILSLINQNTISRIEIAKRTGLSRAAVTIIADELIRKGYIIEKPASISSVGRQPIFLNINKKALYTIGINISRETISVGISDFSGTVIIEETNPTTAPNIFFDSIYELTEKVISNSNVKREKIYGVGVVTPGPVDIKNGRILNAPKFNAWNWVNIVEELNKRIDFNVMFANVSGGFALAEKYYGIAKNSTDFMSMNVENGIGSGIIFNNKLFDGIGEIGHTSICYNGIQCECGNKGCLEKYASIPSILHNTGFSRWQDAVDNYRLDIITKEAEFLGTAITNANNIFNFDMIILCGDVSYKPDMLINAISDHVKNRVLIKDFPGIFTGKISSPVLIASSIALYGFYNL